jgi:very-short-patch-repair endonuclease
MFCQKLFFEKVRNKEFHQIDFDRQKIIGNYIVDFYIKSLGVVLEIDGSSHNDKEVMKIKTTVFRVS